MPLTAEQSAAATFLATHEFGWKPRNEWADNAAKDISARGVADRPLERLPEQAKMLREAGHHDQAKILEDHHAAETARLAAEKAAQPQPVQAPPQQLQSLTPVPAYVSPLDPKGRKRAVTSFYMHPHAKPLLEAHSVNVPGLDKKEAFRRAEAAYEAYHAQQTQSQPQQPGQPQPAPATQNTSSGVKQNTQAKDGVLRFPNTSRMLGGLGIDPGPHPQEPDMAAVFRPVSAAAVAERDNEMREAIRRQNSGSPAAKKAAQHDTAVRAGQAIPAQYVDAVMKNLNDHGYYQSANSLLYRKNTGSNLITDGSQRPAAQQPVATQPEAAPVAQEPQPVVAQQQPSQPQTKAGPRRLSARELRAVYEAEKLANEGPRDAITPKFGYSSHTAPPSRFQQLLAAAKAGKLKEHVEGGLGNFFDKFERHGNKILNRLGIDTGEGQFSRSQMAAVEFLLTSEFARIKPSDRQRGFVFDDKPATKSKGWEPPVVESKLKQRKLGWEEDKHPRESAAHDNKRPGEFAPRDHAHEEPSPEPKEKATEPAATAKYFAKGNEVYDADGKRLAAFRNDEKAKETAERWNTEGRPVSVPTPPQHKPRPASMKELVEAADVMPEQKANGDSVETKSPSSDKHKLDGVIPGMEPEQPDETPREAAERQDKAMDADYEFARQSSVRNVGEDLKGSARHKRNAWRGLEDAEENGTAAELVTRDNLLKAEPHDLMTIADESPLSSLAGFFALRAFPAKPGPSGRRSRKPDEETAKKDRKQFLETYQEFKKKVESVAKDEPDPIKAINELHGWVKTKISDLRQVPQKDRGTYSENHSGADKYNNTANGLVDTLNALKTGYGHRKTGVASRLHDFAKLAMEKYGDSKPDVEQLAEHAKDIIEGRSMPDAFGAKGSKKEQFSAADAYVKKAIRKGGRDVSSLTKRPNQAAENILKKFGARGVQWGNSVTDDERIHHASKLVESLADLADMTGIKPEDLSLGGKLGWAIGARGHGWASAHYEPGTQVINLTRKSGVGALAHEWAHAFDHAHSGFNIISDGEKRMGDYESGNWYPQKFKRDEKGEFSNVDQSKDPLWQAYEEVRKAWAKSGFDKRLSDAVSHHVHKGTMSKGKREYWLSRHEKFARTFERFIQHKLRANGRDNTYLSGLADSSGIHSLWPNDEESEAMAPAFEKLLAHYRKSKYGDEKPQEFSRSDAIEFFTGEVAGPDRLIRSGDQSGFLDALEFLVENEFARKPAVGQKSLFESDDTDSSKGGWTPPVVAPKPKQKAFGWNEESHPRETKPHDNKRPGEFAPRETASTASEPQEPSTDNAVDELLKQYPSLANSLPISDESARDSHADSPTEEPPMTDDAKPQQAAASDGFDPERDGGYKPLLAIGKEIDDGKLSVEEFRAKYKLYRDHGTEFMADLTKRFNATQLKNIAANFGSYSAKTNTKEQNAKSVYHSLMINVFHVDSSGMFSYGMEGPLAALDSHVASVTDDSFKKVKAESEAKEAKKSEEEAAAQEGIKNPQTLEDYRNAIRHYGGYANLPEDMQEKFDEFHSNRRREESAKTKAKVTGFSGGTEATGATSIVEGHHQKKNVPTYTVTIENHLGDGWDDVLARARQLGGNYVNGRVARMYRATPGFQFFSKEDAEKFQKTLGGEEVDRSDRLDERNIAKMDNASERLSALAESTKQRAEEKLNAPRQTNTERRAEAAASAASTARSEIAKAETMQRISEGLSKGELKHLGGIRSRTHVDALDKMLHGAKYNAWHEAKDKSQGSYDEMRERDATSADISKAKYPYPRIWDHNLDEHLKELSETPGLKNLARTIGKSTNKSPYKKKIGSIAISGGEAKTAAQLSDFSGINHFVGDKAIRIHATHDPKLLKGRHTVAYTADGGKSWGTTQDIAVSAAMANAVHGKNHLDLIDPPSHEQIEIRDPETISNLQKAIKILKRKSNPRLKRVAESLGMHMEDYNRLQAMDITTPQELRAALREYAPLKKKQDKEDPVKTAERKLIGRKIEGFFPTPRPAIDKMLAAADIQPGMSVLEPSAGKGDILDAVKENHPDAKSVGIEPHSDLRELIGMKGHEVHEDRDFLEHKGQYDRIIMNPPFENRQDVAHVRHAFEQLKPGGKLVAIMGAGVFGGSSKKDQEFRDWLDEQGGEVEDMPEGSFNGADAFRKTGVNTRMVVIDKPDHKQFSRDLASVYESFTGQAAVISA